MCLIGASPGTRKSGEKTVQELEREERERIRLDEVQARKRHSRAPSLPHRLPPMEQVASSSPLSMGFHGRQRSEASTSRTGPDPTPMPTYPFSAEHMVHARDRLVTSSLVGAAAGASAAIASDIYANMPATPPSAGSGSFSGKVDSPLLGHVPRSTPPRMTLPPQVQEAVRERKASARSSGTGRASKRERGSIWEGASIMNDASRNSKERKRQSQQSQSQPQSLIPPYPLLSEGSNLVPAALPFPLRPEEDHEGESTGDLTPPQGSAGLPEPDDDEEDEEETHEGEEDGEEEEDDLAGLDLDGFVVDDEEDEDMHQQYVQPPITQTYHHHDSPPRHPRISDETNAGSGSISSLGQPISSTFPFVLDEQDLTTSTNAPPRSFSLGSGSHSSSPLSHRAYSPGVYGEGSDEAAPEVRSLKWSFSNSASSRSKSIASRARTGSQASSAPRSRAGSLLDAPPRHPSAGSRRRGRADTIPSPLNSSVGSHSNGSGFSEFGERMEIGPDGRARPRTISMQDQTFGVQIPLPPVPGTEDDDLVIGSDDEEEDHRDLGAVLEDEREGRPPTPLSPVGSMEEGEREDSVGLLSHGPSPKSSIGVLRSRASSLVSIGRRRGSQGSQTSGSVAYASAQSASAPRSRADSLARSRSRKSSLVSASTAAPPPLNLNVPFPQSTQLRHSRSGESTPSSLRSGNQTARFDEEDHTFGFSRPVNWDEVPRLSSGGPSRHISIISGRPPPLPMPSPEARRSLRPSPSRSTTGNRSDSGQTSSQVPLTPATETEFSEAPSSYVTAAPTVESTSEGANTIRSYRALDDLSREVM